MIYQMRSPFDFTRVRCSHFTHAKDSRDADQIVGAAHFGQGRGQGGRQQAHPQPSLQYQNRV